MIGDHQGHTLEFPPSASNVSHLGTRIGLNQGIGGGSTKGHDYLWLHHFQLGLQVREAEIHFLFRGRPISKGLIMLGAPIHDVSDVDAFAGQARRGNYLVQQLACGTDKGLPFISSSWPGASPQKKTSAAGLPTPNTTLAPGFRLALQVGQATTKSRSQDMRLSGSPSGKFTSGGGGNTEGPAGSAFERVLQLASVSLQPLQQEAPNYSRPALQEQVSEQAWVPELRRKNFCLHRPQGRPQTIYRFLLQVDCVHAFLRWRFNSSAPLSLYPPSPLSSRSQPLTIDLGSKYAPRTWPRDRTPSSRDHPP